MGCLDERRDARWETYPAAIIEAQHARHLASPPMNLPFNHDIEF